MSILNKLGKELLFFEGGMGTSLQKRGLKPGELPEVWNLTHPDVICDIHLAYLNAGCNIIKLNTFGANPLKFSAKSELKTIIGAALVMAQFYINDEVRTIGGRIVYLDKTNKHMYELSNKIRLVNVKDYMTQSSEEFLGFLSGIISQDNDIEKIYIDSFLKVACVGIPQLQDILEKIEERSKAFKVDFVLSISLEKEQLPLDYQKSVVLSL